MSDPRLNSVHLDAPRREVFRFARARLLNARGKDTLADEARAKLAEIPSGLNAITNQVSDDYPPGLKYWLEEQNNVYPLKVGLNTVGRAPENDVVVAESAISRRHCVILVHKNNSYELHDIASKNGTYLNGERLVRPTPLTPGDEIRICNRRFVFLARTDAASEPDDSITDAE